MSRLLLCGWLFVAAASFASVPLGGRGLLLVVMAALGGGLLAFALRP